jgi:hypothetical protein
MLQNLNFEKTAIFTALKFFNNEGKIIFQREFGFLERRLLLACRNFEAKQNWLVLIISPYTNFGDHGYPDKVVEEKQIFFAALKLVDQYSQENSFDIRGDFVTNYDLQQLGFYNMCRIKEGFKFWQFNNSFLGDHFISEQRYSSTSQVATGRIDKLNFGEDDPYGIFDALHPYSEEQGMRDIEDYLEDYEEFRNS